MAIVVAEAGTNHASNNSYEVYVNALNLVRWAKHCGADAVKFQLFLPGEPLFCPMEGDERRWQRWSKTFIPDWVAVKKYCDDLKIELILSAFQKSGVELVNELGLRHKVASRALKSYPYEDVRGEMVISYGSAMPMAPRRDGVLAPVVQKYRHFALKCVSKYPAPLEECRWDMYDGLSDHSGTVWPALDALSRGAEIVEVHFRPELFDPGPDAAVELTCDQLKFICEARDAFKEMRSE